jgi:hypothetical protein
MITTIPERTDGTLPRTDRCWASPGCFEV